MSKELMLAWLQSRLDAMKHPIAKAIYAGLISRVMSGQFDE